MTRLVRNYAVAVGCALLLATGAWAQVGSIDGNVVGEDGKPFEGALIRIERVDLVGNYSVKTDRRGHYFHAGIPRGTYNVFIEVDGEVKDRMDNIQVSSATTSTVNFDLADVARRVAELQKAAETGQFTEEQLSGLSAEQKAELEKQMAERAETLRKNKELNDAYNAAMTAKKARQYDVAIENFKKAAAVDSSQEVIFGQLAATYAESAATKSGSERAALFGEAVATYEHVLTMVPDDPAYLNNYALALAGARRLTEAVGALEKAAAADPPGAGQYYYNLGAVLINEGGTDEAVTAFQRSIEANPNYAQAYFQLGMALLGKASIGDDGSLQTVPGTREALEKYLSLAPNGELADSARGALESLGTSVSTTIKQ
jgi:tetratricopeptide (TPR) repeat protein